MQFIRCRTCGRYLQAGAAVRLRYCSEECAAQYASCRNCGRYYRSGSGHDALFCSPECAVQYRLQPSRLYSEEKT